MAETVINELRRKLADAETALKEVDDIIVTKQREQLILSQRCDDLRKAIGALDTWSPIRGNLGN